MEASQASIPDSSAVRTALWRALHLQVDAEPHILTDEIGLKLADPPEGWQQRGDMHPQGTRGYRASILARARFVEDEVLEQRRQGVTQYVILGAGLDSFAQRRPPSAEALQVFEVDQPATQAWKRQRLEALGYGVPEHLHLVPVDFEAGESWKKKLVEAGYLPSRPAVLSSTGVSMYLTREAVATTLRDVARLAPGSTLLMTFTLPLDLLPAEDRPMHERVYAAAAAAGTPFLSFFRPGEMVALAQDCGFRAARHVSMDEIAKRYFSGRTDGLWPAKGEEFLVAEN